MKIELRANAKINLFLDILAKLPNGYHSLFMVMQSVSLADTVTVQENGEGIIRLTCSEPALPTDSKNIAYRAAQAFLEEAGLSGRGVDIHIEKNIPFEAGLAGGSADGAGVIVGLDRLFETDMGTQKLCDIGLKIGSDVPFCIAGGTMLSQHTGGILSHLPPLKAASSCSQSPQRASQPHAPTAILIPRASYIIRIRLACSTLRRTPISRVFAVRRAMFLNRL